ncbi:hypothetical protein MTR_2g008630 [Medicago truncatula]|uniref:Uncharacterized protein n=1 Tax=Medicago truncatula TaxID=3880 RepID=G7INU1_MEDTR|nr:hypothetical protein MTR_2g008630 [Medicago truncatula]
MATHLDLNFFPFSRTGFNSLDFVFSLLSYFNAAKSQHHKVLQGSHDNLKTNRDRTWFDSAKQKRQIIVSSLHSIVISALILSVDFVDEKYCR